jgi:hypothetical protein
VIPTRRRTQADFPPGVDIPATERRTCMEEGRGAVMTFFWMRAKSRA